MAKKSNRVKEINVKKENKDNNNNLLPIKSESKALVVVKPKKLDLVINFDKNIFSKVIKGMSLALIGTISIAYIALMIVVATSIFYVSHLRNGLIQKGVYVNGINVSNLSGIDAFKNLSTELNGTIPEYIVLKYNEKTYQLGLQDLGLNFDVQNAVSDAYAIGRTQNVVKDLWQYVEVMNNTVNVNAKLEYNCDVLDNFIKQISEQLPDKVQEYTYVVEGNILTISNGKNGVALDEEALKNIIINRLENRDYSNEIEIPIYETFPQEIDLVKIHNEICVEAQDAFVEENPFVIHQEIIGINFDINNAQNIINNKNQEKYIIELELTTPSICVKDLNIFPDMLSTFCTNYVNNPNRTTNLILASNKINGVVLMPGEKFSFNEVVGERTIAAGYKNAAIFVNGQVEDGLAGGICQVSSTLYDAVIGANLEIVERHNHSKFTSYLPGGKDATVVWGRYDFQFKNSREYPIKIEMSIQNGIATASIYGIKTNEEYEIVIESQCAGTVGTSTVYNAYKVYKQNGIEVKREFLSKDFYK